MSAKESCLLRRGAKRTLFAVAFLAVLPLSIVCWLERHFARNETLFSLCAQTLALVPGFPGVYLRSAFYFGALERCSWETHFGFGTFFTHRGARIGQRVSTGAYCVLGHAQIGAAAMIGSRVSIPSGRRQHLDEEGRLAPIMRFDVVAIGAGSWVGEGAILVANVGEKCIVAAGAIVTRDMPNGCLVAGNPARVIRAVGPSSHSTAGT